MKYNPVHPTTGTFEVWNKIMLKCPNCGTEVDLTWKKYFRAGVCNKIMCTECSRRLAVDLPDGMSIVLAVVFIAVSAPLSVAIAIWVDGIFSLNSMEALLVALFLEGWAIFFLACILKPLGEKFGVMIDFEEKLRRKKEKTQKETKHEDVSKIPDEVQDGTTDTWSV